MPCVQVAYFGELAPARPVPSGGADLPKPGLEPCAAITFLNLEGVPSAMGGLPWTGAVTAVLELGLLLTADTWDTESSGATAGAKLKNSAWKGSKSLLTLMADADISELRETPFQDQLFSNFQVLSTCSCERSSSSTWEVAKTMRKHQTLHAKGFGFEGVMQTRNHHKCWHTQPWCQKHGRCACTCPRSSRGGRCLMSPSRCRRS